MHKHLKLCRLRRYSEPAGVTVVCLAPQGWDHSLSFDNFSFSIYPSIPHRALKKRKYASLLRNYWQDPLPMGQAFGSDIQPNLPGCISETDKMRRCISEMVTGFYNLSRLQLLNLAVAC